MPMTPTCQPSFASTSTRSLLLRARHGHGFLHHAFLDALALGVVVVEQLGQFRRARRVAGEQQFQRGHRVGEPAGRVEPRRRCENRCDTGSPRPAHRPHPSTRADRSSACAAVVPGRPSPGCGSRSSAARYRPRCRRPRGPDDRADRSCSASCSRRVLRARAPA